ncbi:MAG: hypothetical protein Q8R43_03170 [Alphaproteobacteria bacterium]|nr:hypothetical protein [Alphaproteobacteria bacterium]
MINTEKYGWNINTIGGIDYQNMTPSFIKLTEYRIGYKSDVVSLYNFRVKKQNQEKRDNKVLQDIEQVKMVITDDY